MTSEIKRFKTKSSCSSDISFTLSFINGSPLLFSFSIASFLSIRHWSKTFRKIYVHLWRLACDTQLSSNLTHSKEHIGLLNLGSPKERKTKKPFGGSWKYGLIKFIFSLPSMTGALISFVHWIQKDASPFSSLPQLQTTLWTGAEKTATFPFVLVHVLEQIIFAPPIWTIPQQVLN